MSLTSELRDSQSPVRGYFESHFGMAKAVHASWRSELGDVATVRPPGDADRPYPHATAGTAINWRLGLGLGAMRFDIAEEGFGLWREYAFGIHPLQDLGGGEFLDKRTGSIVESAQPGRDVFSKLEAELLKFCADWSDTRHPLDSTKCEYLCRRCWALALLEQVFRAGPVALQGPLSALTPSSSLGDLLALAPGNGVADCCQLADLAQRPLIEAFADVPQDRRHLDPVFSGSGDVGGADGDFILGDCLLDCKATINPLPSASALRPWLWQLLGYVGLDYEDEYKLGRVGIYLARQGRCVIWDLPALLLELSEGRCNSVDQLRAELRALVHVDRGSAAKKRPASAQP